MSTRTGLVDCSHVVMLDPRPELPAWFCALISLLERKNILT